jgi:hypothetical protein
MSLMAVLSYSSHRQRLRMALLLTLSLKAVFGVSRLTAVGHMRQPKKAT